MEENAEGNTGEYNYEVESIPNADTVLEPIEERHVIISFDVGIVNLGMCVIALPNRTTKRSKKVSEELLQLQGEIYEWDIICLAREGEKATKIQLTTLAKRLYEALDILWDKYKSVLTTVLIENQPSRLNGHMKSIQMLIYGYYLHKAHMHSHELDVCLINASKKLQSHTCACTHISNTQPDKIIPITTETAKAKRYSNNKHMAVLICEYYLREDENLLRKMKSHKKKDDLSDAMLQAISWYHTKYKCELACVKSS